VSEARFQRVVDAWIAAQDMEIDDPDYNPNNWAIQLIVRWRIRNKPDQMWRFIRAVLDRNVSDTVLMTVACGPLEDLLSCWGEDYIEPVEKLAASNANFRGILRAVYKRSMTPDAWARLQALVVANAESIDPTPP